MNTKTTLNKLKQNLQGQWALITGASSGMGRDYAHILAAAGADLVITARRTERLEQLAQEIRSTYHVRVEIMTSDLGMLGAGSELKKRIENKGIKIDVLINNAGLGLFGEFEKTPLEETLKMLQVDIVALTELTKIFVDDMKIRGRGHILLVGSVGAYQPTPTYAAYAAAKSYVLNFGEALSYELRSSGVKLACLTQELLKQNFLKLLVKNQLFTSVSS